MPRRRNAVDAAARESPRLANEHDGVKSNAGNGESMVVTTESLLNDKKNIAADSYEKVLLPRVRSTTIRVTPSIAKGDLLKRAAQRTEVETADRELLKAEDSEGTFGAHGAERYRSTEPPNQSRRAALRSTGVGYSAPCWG